MGPERRTRVSRSSSWLTTSAFEIEERHLLELVAFGILEQPSERNARDRAPAQAGDDGVAVERYP